MLRPRVIPCLLLRDGGLVKTTRFKDPKYVGDPLNAVRILNEKEVDELIVLDIDATRDTREPDYRMIANLAAECRMPLCYGGGVRSLSQAEKIIGMGVEKVALSAVAVEKPDLIAQMAELMGNQSVVVVVDIKIAGLLNGYQVFTHNGSKRTGEDAIVFIRRMEELGAGEIVINSIDRDGTMSGYDIKLVRLVRDSTTLPLTVLGGAGSLEDIRTLVEEFGIIGAAAGSLFVFKGPYRAVLINYPRKLDKESLFVSDV